MGLGDRVCPAAGAQGVGVGPSRRPGPRSGEPSKQAVSSLAIRSFHSSGMVWRGTFEPMHFA